MERKTTEERRNEIINASIELIAQEGIQNLTIKNISRQINISEAGIYRHFMDKHSILMALADDFEDNLMRVIEYPIRNHKNPLLRLQEIMKAHMSFTEEQKGILFAITAESIHSNDDKLRRKILEVIYTYTSKIRGILEEGKRRRLVRGDINLDSASLLFFGMVHTAIVQYALTNYTVSPMKKFSKLWNIFLEGIAEDGDHTEGK
ncbi:MAG: TetR/AcrR family transcriptional regulator [bacterium]